MILHEIGIANFKNIEEGNITFSPKVNCLIGNNGQGKTNVLDAIFYLSFTKSFFNTPDQLVVRHDAPFMMLRGKYSRKGEATEISVGLQVGKHKRIKRDGKEYRRITEHIGLLPLVMVSPLDSDLIRGASDGRRRLIDMIISQADKEYLSRLMWHQKAIEHRNMMLRQGYTDPLLFASVEEQIIDAATYIHQARTSWVKAFEPIFMHYYQAIAGPEEQVQLRYVSHLNAASAREVLDQNRQRDIALGYTSAGVHRDDIELLLDGHPMRATGSQGQCKSYTIALRFAQYHFLKNATAVKPILLLDDIFDKLDSIRVQNIVDVVSSNDFGQIFITDTNLSLLDDIVKKISADYTILMVEKGCISTHSNS